MPVAMPRTSSTMLAMIETPSMMADVIHMALPVLLLAAAVAQSPASMAFFQALPATMPMMEVTSDAMGRQPQQVSTDATHSMMLTTM